MLSIEPPPCLRAIHGIGREIPRVRAKELGYLRCLYGLEPLRLLCPLYPPLQLSLGTHKDDWCAEGSASHHGVKWVVGSINTRNAGRSSVGRRVGKCRYRNVLTDTEAEIRAQQRGAIAALSQVGTQIKSIQTPIRLDSHVPLIGSLVPRA